MLVATNLHKSFDRAARPALDDLSLTIAPGSVVALLGPSGCGKSTLLNVIAGLTTADRGRLCWQDQVIDPLPPEQRRFGLMFQDYALFPHLDVLANVAFGPIEAGHRRYDAEVKARQWLGRVGLGDQARRPVWALSGGQRQRVALARALAAEPRLLLLDEPLSNLDRQLRRDLQDLLAEVLHETGTATLIVTHDQGEAFSLADRVAVMQDGRILQEGPADQVWRQPCNAWTARFLGHRNVSSEATILDEAYRFTGPEQAHIARITAIGPAFELILDHQGRRHQLTLSRREALALGSGAPPQAGQTVPFAIDPAAIYHFPTGTAGQ